jgi:hypothetical protein
MLKLPLVLSAVVSLYACGAQPATDYWRCYDSGSANEQAFGPHPHAPVPVDTPTHLCTEEEFQAANIRERTNWHRAPGKPGGWDTP